MKLKSTTIGHLLALLTVLVWSVTYISTKVLLEAFSPLELLVFRFTIGYLALWAAHPKPMRLHDIRHEWLFVAAGLCGVSLYNIFQNTALTFTMASNVGVILSTVPFFIALFAHLFLKTNALHPQFLLGFVLALGGVVLISLNGASLHFSPVGDILTVGAAVCWGVYVVFVRRISMLGYATIPVTRRVFFYGLVLLVPVVLASDFTLDFTRFLSPVITLHMLFLGVAASALCFVTWNAALERLGPVTTGTYLYLSPVITVAVSAVALGEPVTPLSVVGTLLALLGLIVSEKLPRKKREQTEQTVQTEQTEPANSGE